MNQNGSSKNDAKDLLLKDYDSLTQSLSESEKIGETRVNWFVGVVTTAAAAFVALVTSKEITAQLTPGCSRLRSVPL